jgi:GNAT superfamily N-acetyltransferase
MSDVPRDDLTIRPATRGEVADVLALYAQPDLDRETLALDQAQALFDRIQSYPDYDVMLAEARGGAVVGTYLLLIMDKLGHQGAPAAVVDDVVVAADRQGQGIGTAMMHDAMARARGRGCYKLTLSSNLKRERAHRFYEKLGFTQHGVSFEVAL